MSGALTSGFKEFQKMMEQSTKVYPNKTKVRILKKVAKILRDKAASLAPKRRGVLSKNIHIAEAKELEVAHGDAAVKVGPGGRGWYGHIVEYGYGRQAPQPFMRPAFEQTQEQMLEAIAVELEKEQTK